MDNGQFGLYQAFLFWTTDNSDLSGLSVLDNRQLGLYQACLLWTTDNSDCIRPFCYKQQTTRIVAGLSVLDNRQLGL